MGNRPADQGNAIEPCLGLAPRSHFLASNLARLLSPKEKSLLRAWYIVSMRHTSCIHHEELVILSHSDYIAVCKQNQPIICRSPPPQFLHGNSEMRIQKQEAAVGLGSVRRKDAVHLKLFDVFLTNAV